MSSSSPAPKPALPAATLRSGRRADALIALAVVAGMLALHVATDLFSGLERRFYDFASNRTERQPSERIAVIAIDDQRIAHIGRWLWPRENLFFPQQNAVQIAKQLAPDASEWRPELPAKPADILTKILVKTPAGRHPADAGLAAGLQRVALAAWPGGACAVRLGDNPGSVPAAFEATHVMARPFFAGSTAASVADTVAWVREADDDGSHTPPQNRAS